MNIWYLQLRLRLNFNFNFNLVVHKMERQQQQLDKYMEGEWNQFTFKRLTPEDHQRILQHLRATFYVDELGCKLLHFGEPEFEGFDAFILLCLSQNDDISFYAEDRATGKIAGVRITYKCAKSDEEPPRPTLEKILQYVTFTKQLKEKCNTFELYGVDNFACFLVQSVDPAFRQRGLASEMYRRSLGLLKERGYPVCQSVFSSPYTRTAVAKLGFEELGRAYFRDYVDEKGVRPFAHAGEDDCTAIMAYRLQ